MQSRDALARASAPSTTEASEPSALDPTGPAEYTDELRRFLVRVPGGEPGALELRWKNETDGGRPSAVVAFRDRRPSLPPDVPGDDLSRRILELEQERATALQAAEYLEAQRATLARELDGAWAAHSESERARGALETALAELRAAHATELDAVRRESERLHRRLDDLEPTHTESAARTAVLEVEVNRLRAELEAACVRANTQATPDHLAETLLAALSELDGLQTSTVAVATRLRAALRHVHRQPSR